MEQFELLAYTTRVFEALAINYFVTGSLASIFYGEPRFTIDIDIVAAVESRHIPELVSAFPAGEIYISEEGMEDALTHYTQFNIIHPRSGLKVDVMIAKMDEFDRSRFSRRKELYPEVDRHIYFASAEDVIIKKMEYYREGGSEKHIRDILSMLRISAEAIDYAYIEAWSGKRGTREIWDSLVTRMTARKNIQ